MNKVINFIFDRRKAFLVLWLLITILGIIEYGKIPRELYPDIRIPVIYVSVNYEAISPKDGERLLIKPIEKEVKTIEGLKYIKSYAAEGRVSIVLEFEAGFDNIKAMQDVRDKIDRAKAELPDGVEEPVLKEVVFSEFPVLNVILTGAVPERALVETGRKLKDKIEELAEILNVNIAGNLEDTVEIIIDPMKLESYGLSMDMIQNIINNNKLIPTGAVETDNSRFAIKLPGLLESIPQIMSLPIKTKDNIVLKIQDIADVVSGFKPRKSLAKVNGENAVTLEVSKRSGHNIIETISNIKELVNHEISLISPNIDVIYAQDGSKRIITNTNDLQNNMIFALILVTLITMTFINFKSAILISLTIPSSFLMAILVLSKMSITLNVVVFFALILSVGLLVDAAIVIVEYANRQITNNVSVIDAFKGSIRRMALPIITSSLTTIIVFLPLLFWPGTVGQFMLFIPITLICTITASLFMALIFIPVIGCWLNPSTSKNIKSKSNKPGIFTKRYIHIIKHILHRPVSFTIVTLLSLTTVIAIFAFFNTGKEFFPTIEPDNAMIKVRMRGNLSVQEKERFALKVYEEAKAESESIKVFYTRSGESSGDSSKGNNAEDVIATISLEFINWQKRDKVDKILKRIRDYTQFYPGMIVETDKEKPGPRSGKNIQMEVTHPDNSKLHSEAKKIHDLLLNNDYFLDVEDSRPIDSIEWKFDINRELAAQLNVNITDIGNFIKLVTNGVTASNYRPDSKDEEVDIILRFANQYRNVTQFDHLRIINSEGKAIPISNFVTRTAQQELTQINRRDGQRIVTINANVKENILPSQAVLLIKDFLKTDILDNDTIVQFRGEDEDSNETQSFLGKAFILALIIMALILILQFNSFYHTFVILSAVFLSTIGVFLGLLLTNTPFGVVMCGVGIIALSGIVVNNNIILIDSYKYYIENGYTAYRAILSATQRRLRPILLTAITTVLGLMPMILRMNIDFLNFNITFGAPSTGWWYQLSTAIAGGLTFATILTLFFTPALLMIGAKLNKQGYQYPNISK
ncbi:MAG: efflux RND transporter permease subunit [Rickettsiales bacterium]|jgi:multidrug efflux pump|nr:efflux RND transporter permease subunit [Rickettsiales bacterium]